MSVEGATIVNNLRDRVNGVNLDTAISGCRDTVKAIETLHLLVRDGIVDEERIKLPNGPTVSLYKYNKNRPGLTPRSMIRSVK